MYLVFPVLATLVTSHCGHSRICDGASTAQHNTAAPLSSLVAHYAVKISLYSHQHPVILFLQVEASFQAAHVTSQQTRYAHLLAALPGDVALQVHYLLTAPQSPAP